MTRGQVGETPSDCLRCGDPCSCLVLTAKHPILQRRALDLHQLRGPALVAMTGIQGPRNELALEFTKTALERNRYRPATKT